MFGGGKNRTTIRLDTRVFLSGDQTNSSIFYSSQYGQHEVFFGFDSGRNLTLRTKCYNQKFLSMVTPFELPIGKWTQITLLIDGIWNNNCLSSASNSKTTLFLDGFLAMEQTGIAFPVQTTRDINTIGQNFSGFIDFLDILQFPTSQNTSQSFEYHSDSDILLDCEFDNANISCGTIVENVSFISQNNGDYKNFNYGMYVWTHPSEGFDWYFPIFSEVKKFRKFPLKIPSPVEPLW
jgi:hypothetical protein